MAETIDEKIEEAEEELEKLKSLSTGVKKLQLEDEITVEVADNLASQISGKKGEILELNGGSNSYMAKGLF